MNTENLTIKYSTADQFVQATLMQQAENNYADEHPSNEEDFDIDAGLEEAVSVF
jgi:hypothetical protein